MTLRWRLGNDGIGVAGLMGFGVGYCRPESLPADMALMSDGSYIHLPSASIMGGGHSGGKLTLKKPVGADWITTGASDAVVTGFSSFTFSGPFLVPRAGWIIGAAGTTPYGVGIKTVGVDEPIHNTSGSIM